MYTSIRKALETLGEWRAQRFSHALFVPVALTLTMASMVGQDWPTLLQATARVVAAWLVVLALRLWDDLEDRERDAMQHPDRVLTQIESAAPFGWIVAFVLLLALPMVIFGGGSAAVFGVVIVALMLFYRTGGQSSAIGDFLVLLKYPALVLALSASWQPLSLVAAGVALVGVALDELMQRQNSGRKLVRAGLLTMTFGLLCVFKFAELSHAS